MKLSFLSLRSSFGFPFAIATVFLVAGAQSGHGATYTWTQAGTGNYGTDSNWSSNAVPTSTDDIVIANGTGINLSTVNRVARDLSFITTTSSAFYTAQAAGSPSYSFTLRNAETAVTSGSLSFRNNLSGGNTGNLLLTITGNLTVNSTVGHLTFGSLTHSDFRANIGSVTVGGTTTINTGATVNLSRVNTGGSVDLGSLSLQGGTLNLTGGEGNNGSSTLADNLNIITVRSLTGNATALIQANKASTNGSLIISGTGAADDSIYAGVISNGVGTSVRLTKAGTSKLTLSGVNTYTGSTTINGGTLLIAEGGSLAAGSAVAVNATGTLAGAGTVDGVVTVNSGGTVSPGVGQGSQTLGSLVLKDGGNFNWQILDTTGAAGTGYDSINLTGTLNLAALTGETAFNINLWSLSAPDTNGNALNFDNTESTFWTLIATDNAILNFDASRFAINLGPTNGTGGFSNTIGDGVFSLALGDNNTDLRLVYTAVPEAGTWSLMAISAVALAFIRGRRKA